MRKGHVVYLSYDGLLEPLGSSQVVPVMEGLAHRGFPMAVLSFEKPEDLRNRAGIRSMEERLGSAGIRWVRRRYHARPSIPATGYDIWSGRSGLRKMLKGGGPSILHARSYVPGIMALGALGSSGARLLLDLRGFWVDERIEAGRWRDGSPTVRLARRGERRLLTRAHHLVHLTRRGMENAGRLVPGSPLPPSTVIPTCVDMDRFRPASAGTSRREELGLGPGPVIVHTGTLSGWYLGEETFRLAAALLARIGGVFLVLTRERDLAGRLADITGTETRILTVSHQEVPEWLAVADVGLCLVRPGFAKTASSPTKVGEYLASGMAVVATAGVGDLEEQFHGSTTALTIHPSEDPGEVAERVAAVLARPGRSGESRALARRHFDLEAGIESYARIYEELGVGP